MKTTDVYYRELNHMKFIHTQITTSFWSDTMIFVYYYFAKCPFSTICIFLPGNSDDYGLCLRINTRACVCFVTILLRLLYINGTKAFTNNSSYSYLYVIMLN